MTSGPIRGVSKINIYLNNTTIICDIKFIKLFDLNSNILCNVLIMFDVSKANRKN